MAELNYRCLGCAAAIFPNLTKTGKVSNHPRKYCGAECKPKRERQRTPHKPKLVVCQHCFTEKYRRVRGGAKDAGKYCSRACSFARASMVSREVTALKALGARARKAERVAAAAKAKREAWLATRQRVCPECGTGFVAELRQSVCSDECREARASRSRARYKQTESWKRARRAAKKRYKTVRRARVAILAETIDPIKVFERDKWKCHLCGEKTPQGLRGTSQMQAPELDHIVTLADGGSHTWGNVACACRRCNLAKGARSLGQIGLGLGA